jgi:tetratricopeptide (TPR) repeat protein/tRNA A-37 threonylcarbamoyl transferase component Bud32
MTRPTPDEEVIFQAARRIAAPEARRRYVEQACGEDQGLRARIDALLRVQDQDPSFLEPPTVGFATASGDPVWEGPGIYPTIPGYEILDELGRGGMGVVYKARQVRLNRLVALKMILSGEHARPEDLVRFLAEAEAVAQIQHPHIVQIHEVSQHAGLPFFVLEFLEGGSLHQRLKDSSLPARQAAHMVEMLARGMHAAHQRGIIHRDLKPANVLLDKEGRPKVTDFGLAKRVEGGTGVTQTGAVMGTPSYMAPEQAEGKSHQIGPAADVYALGAILYELLTGRPPFKAATPLETVVQVVSDDPISPSRLQPKLPRDLVTICLKCLQKEPRKRYPSAEALAEDLRRFLEHRPIVGRPTPAWERLLKWTKRHPEAVGIAVSFLAVVCFAFGFVFTRWQGATERAEMEARARAVAEEQKRQADQAREEAAQQRDAAAAARAEAEKSFRRACQVIEDLTTFVQKDEHLTGPGLDPARIALLEIARKFYQGFLERGDEDLKKRIEAAEAHCRLAGILSQLGSSTEAMELNREALDLYEKLAAEQPGVAEYQAGLASALYQRGSLNWTEPTQAAAAYRRALGLAEKLVLEHPKEPRHVTLLADVHVRLADCDARSGQLKAAETGYEQALRLRQELARDHAEDPDYQAGLADGYSTLARFYRERRRSRESEDAWHKAVEILERLASLHPKVLWYRDSLGHCYHELGYLYQTMSRSAEAEAAYRKTQEIREQIARDDPTYPGIQERQAWNSAQLARLYHNTGRPKEAEATYLKAVDVYEKLVRDHPARHQTAYDLGRVYGGMAELFSASSNPAASLPWFAKAKRTFEGIPLVGESSRDARGYLAVLALRRTGIVDRVKNQALALARRGNHCAAATAAEAVAGVTEVSGDTLFNLARTLARCTAAASSDPKLAAAERAALGEQYGSRAVQLLAKARAAGLSAHKEDARPENLAKDPAFQALQARKDFKALLSGPVEKSTPGPK